MRIRVTVAAVSGALALSALAAPSALAADSGSSHKLDLLKTAQAAIGHTASGKSSFSGAAADEAPVLDATFSNFKIAKAIKVGTTNHVTAAASYTITHGADVDVTSDDFITIPALYRGSFDEPDNVLVPQNEPGVCKVVSATVANCSAKIDIYPLDGDLISSDAGTWHAAGIAANFDENDPENSPEVVQGSLGTTLVQRVSRLTVNASPEPVKKGATITVTGALTRANWDDNKYHGYTGQSVQLQFRKKSSSTYTTVKTIKTDSKGNLKTTVKASADGYFRYNFAGTTTTPAIVAAGDFVDVK
ncbi:hypothetical protein [Streptomyces sp. NPDC005573]|uniref:hypothetical protein n=1 Tax=unclassified Streptomyces TaxID=2593676 RepID=UPI0033A255AD